MNLRRLTSIVLCIVVLCPSVLIASVVQAPQSESKSRTSKTKTKKSKRTRKPGVEQITLPTYAIPAIPTNSVQQEIKKPSIGSGASKSGMSTQSVQRAQDEDPTSQPVPIQVSKTVTVNIRNVVQKNPKSMGA